MRPISPKHATPGLDRRRRGRPRRSRARPPRSAPGSSIRTPPATFTKTSAWPSATPAWRPSTATIIESRFGSTPVPTRRGIARSVGETSAWISSRIGRVPSSAQATAEPGCSSSRPAEELATDRRRRRGPPRSSRRRRARSSSRSGSSPRAGRGASGSGRPRTGARSRRGARGRAGRRRRRPSSRGRRGRWRCPAPSRTPQEAAGGLAHLADRARAPSRAPARRASARSRSTQTSGRSRSSVAQTSSRFVSARIWTSPAPPSRSARSFTWAADSSPVTSTTLPLVRHRPQRHEEQRRLADARVAGDEDERGRDEPAAEHAVELGNAGRDRARRPRPRPRRAEGAADPAAGAPRTPARRRARSSTSVPQPSHAGQRPSHLPVVYPHSEHACWTAAFAMSGPV